jgi:hypothetical protein
MLPFCTPEDIIAQENEIIQRLADPAGGLMLFASPSRDVPLENIEALCTAWEKYCSKEYQ